MEVSIIRLKCKQYIHAGSLDPFEKNVFNFSYKEFWIKSQVYNPEGKFPTFTQLKENDGRANSLHYKSGFGVSGFIGLLNNKIPNTKDNLGEALSFAEYSFEVVESDKNDKSKNAVAITYATAKLRLMGNFGYYLVLARETGFQPEKPGAIETITLQMQPHISISAVYK